MPPMDNSTLNDTAFLPKARVSDLVLQTVGTDILVYDTNTKQANHLNETTSFVWNKCDGRTTVDEVAAALSKESGLKIENDLVFLALEELDKAKLLDGDVPESESQLSRRKVLLRYAAPAVALPIVMSLVAPVSAQMGSCLGAGGIDCLDPLTPCCPGLVCMPLALGVRAQGECVPPVVD